MKVYHEGRYGRWENQRGYSVTPSDPPYIWRRGALLFFRKYKISLVDVTFSEIFTPAYVTEGGVRYTCVGTCPGLGPHLVGSDNGSVPPDLQGISVDNAGHALPFFFHDFMCRKGYVYIDWRMMPVTRKQADKLLRLMIMADGLGRWQARKVYAGVRIGANTGLARHFASEGVEVPSA